MICSTLRHLFNDVEIYEYGSNEKELYLKFKLSENVEKDILLKKIINDAPKVYNEIIFEKSELELIDYIQILKTNREVYFADLFDKFLLFGEYSFVNDEQIELVKHLYENNFKYEVFKSNNEELLKSVQYSALKINELFAIDLLKPQQKNLILSLQCYWTYLFINLDALIRNLKDNDIYTIRLNKILSSIPIKKYNRFNRKNPTEVNSIDKLIRHYRDAVCHLEEKDNRIKESYNDKYSGLMIFQSKNKYGIKYGDGYINWETDLLKLIKQMTNLLVGEKTISIIKGKENGKYLFSILYTDFGDLRFRLLKQKYRIEKNNINGMYTIFLEKIA